MRVSPRLARVLLNKSTAFNNKSAGFRAFDRRLDGSYSPGLVFLVLLPRADMSSGGA